MQKLSKADLDSGASVSSVFITKSRKTSSGWKLPEGAFVFRLTSSLDKLSSGSVPLCSGWRWWRRKKVRMRDASWLFAAKSLQSRPTLCDPIDGSPPGSPSLGFSRQEHWSGSPFPSPMHESEKWKKGKLLSCIRLFATPWTAAYQAPSFIGFSRQEYWSGVPSPSLKLMLYGTIFSLRTRTAVSGLDQPVLIK